MAGKTLLGIGNGGRDGASRSHGDAQGERGEGGPGIPTSLAAVNSGPTLVDDEKVKEGLRRLRSLDSSSHSRPSVDPLAASVARSLEALPTEPHRRDDGPAGGALALPTTSPSAAAARSLDHLVPLSEGGSGPNPVETALVRRPPNTIAERGTLVGRDLHLPPEFGGKGREPSREQARELGRELDRPRGRPPVPPRPGAKQPPRLPAGVKPPLPRVPQQASRRRVDDTMQVRSRPNLAARVVIVLATAAAVALLGVAGIRWHQDGEISSRPRAPGREWPSSETLPTHGTTTVTGTTPATAPTRAQDRPGTGRAPSGIVTAGAGPSPGGLAPGGGSPSSNTAAGQAAPRPPARAAVAPSTAPAGFPSAASSAANDFAAAEREGSALDARPEGSARRHRREKAPSPPSAPTTASAPTTPTAPTTAPTAPTSPPSLTPPPASRDTKPVKQRGGKDDPDSTLPLDLD